MYQHEGVHANNKFWTTLDLVKEIVVEIQLSSSSIDIRNIYGDNKTLFCDAIRNKDYDSILKLYNRKKLYKQIGHYVGLQNKEWAPLIVRLANGKKRDDVWQGLKKYFGNLPD